ncbi:hypothetical protein DHD32_14330 [Arenibacter sp. TNZ]|uniref:hypothetical protein n=1 Tax=Arenibacter TaxID=178469 RepID=UPI000CD46087|nr:MULTISPECIES: hypothetical protein [Arenibacter]MCM4172665.1 hypothetical protein [Arenibacter sp. TNZ]
MKTKIILFAILSLGYLSCKQAIKEDATSKETYITNGETEKVPHLNNDWVAEMALNNGIKWEANLETTSGIAAMSKMIAETKTLSLEDYRNLGNTFNEVKNTIVKECTMTGASHDNLHVFLHPLIQKIEILQNTTSTDEGAKIKESIKGQLKSYYTYFD